MPHKANSGMQQCIDNCNECHDVCLETLQHCIKKGGLHTEPKHLSLLQDCIEICRTSADFMLRGSERHVDTCELCSTICEECAEDCKGMGDDREMQRCAEICQKCAESCQEMAAIKA